jgi:polysaccharide export outer membrane protein
MRLSKLAVIAAFASGLAACGPQRPYVWVHELPPDAANIGVPGDYVVRVGDVINVRVLDHDTVSTKVRVRTDGRIAMPMLGDIDVAGRRPSTLRGELEGRLKDYIVAPSVTVNIEEQQPVQVTVLGEVTRPGIITLTPGANIAQALATAGGLTEYADRDDIYIIRGPQDVAVTPGRPGQPAVAPRSTRIRFTYEALSRGEPRATAFALHPGDLVVVE